MPRSRHLVFNGLFLGRPFSGTGNYSIHLLRELAALRSQDRITVLTPEPVGAALPENLSLQTVPSSRRWAGRGLALDHWETKDIAAAMAELGPDLYHTPYPTPPLAAPCPVVMTVHDMIPYQFPQYRRSARSFIKLGRQRRGINRADHILTVSERSRQEIISQTRVDPAKVSVTYDGIDGRFNRAAPVRTVRAVRDKYGLTRPFVLYFGGFDYRKNVRGLVAAFGKSGLAATHDLVIAGAVVARRTKLYADFTELPSLIRAAGVNHQTHVVGFVSEEEKHALLTAADAFAYPSLAEGFGIPIGEALAVGTPVLGADIAVNRELFAGAIALLPPSDQLAMARALRELVKDAGAERRRTGKRVAARFTWEAVAERTSEAYDRLL